jgi:gamma-glutamyltranspeptidase/glutathione hydrolase
MTEEDLAAHQCDWVDPISVEYRGYELHEIPPNGQGIAALVALGILRNFDLASHPVDSADSLHLQIEAMKLAFADVWANVSDPATMRVTTEEMLDAEYLAGRARLIDMTRTREHTAGIPRGGGTVYLTTADEKGMMLSFIQSNYMGFGSGIVVPGTGISLQNRGAGFSLQPGHPNQVGPRKRPFQTIIPGFLTRGGEPVMSFGVMGGNMQPQGHMQMVTRLVDYQQNPQSCSDGPRWIVNHDFTVSVEDDIRASVKEELTKRGHRLVPTDRPMFGFGGAQLIHRFEDGYCAGSDHRKDGCALGF